MHAATGGRPEKGHEGDAIDAAPLPPRVKQIVRKCLALDGKNRPQTADEVLDALRGWE